MKQPLYDLSISLAVLCLVGGSFTGCAPRGEVREIVETRRVDASDRRVPLHMTSAERFNLAEASNEPDTTPDSLTWDAPAGWQPLPPTAVRLADFRVSERGECSLSVLRGMGGGIEANIDRWRAQMGLAPASPEEIAALPRVEILGRPSPVVEITGAFSGMSGRTETDWALLGAVCVQPEAALFVKMIGPAEEILPQREAFLAFCRSIRRRDGE